MQPATNNKSEENKVTSNAGPTGLAAAPIVATTPDTKVDETKTDETKTDETKTDETKTDETKDTTTFKKSDDPEVEAYAVYNAKGAIVKMYRKGPHGDNFAELAQAYAERKSTTTDVLTAKAYFPPVNIEEVDTDTVHIVTVNNQPLRTFSLKVHGKDYKNIAKAFVEKHGIKKGYKIK